MWPIHCRLIAAVLLMLLSSYGVASASNTRTSWINNLHFIGYAIESYHDAFGHYPSDICDRDGKAILAGEYSFCLS